MPSSDLLYITGAPLNSADDKLLGQAVKEWSGSIVVSGGTTAKIVARELGRSITVMPNARGVMLPPASRIYGIDVVSEGAITLSCVRDLLRDVADDSKPLFLGMEASVDKKIVHLLLSHRKIVFMVGTKLNEAHFDSSLPISLERRVDIISDIVKILREDFRKKIEVEFL